MSMGFAEAVHRVLLTKYATFSGRASWAEYWWFQLLYWALVAVDFYVFITVMDPARGPHEAWVENALFFVPVLFVLATLLPQTALHARRFQDCGISSSRYGMLVGACIIPGFAMVALPAIIVICLLPGTEGPNEYGPDSLIRKPKAEVVT